MKKNKHTFVVLAYKESKYLEESIKSVLNQTVKTNVVIGTSTPNKYISKIAKKYNLKVIENKDHRSIGGDYDFALRCVDSELVTIAHQDDIYDENYVETILNLYNNNPKALILIPDYYELKENQKIYTNTNFKIKRIMLFPLRFKCINGTRFIKRLSIRFGDPICCPAVTFVQKKLPKKVFECELTCSVDWYAWEVLSREKGSFAYCKKSIMGHRIHEESTTTKTITENRRTKEDIYMFKKFWPECIAKVINKFYINAEKSNNMEK